MFGKHYAGKPLCFEPMIQNVILPQSSLDQARKTQDCLIALCFDFKVIDFTVFRLCFDPMIHNVILPKISFAQENV